MTEGGNEKLAATFCSRRAPIVHELLALLKRNPLLQRQYDFHVIHAIKLDLKSRRIGRIYLLRQIMRLRRIICTVNTKNRTHKMSYELNNFMNRARLISQKYTSS